MEPNIDNIVHDMLNKVPSNFCARLESSVKLILVPSVCSSLRMEKLDAHRKKFVKFYSGQLY